MPTANGTADASSTNTQLPYISILFAIDDSLNRSLFVSNKEMHPWYQLTLPEERMIHTVTIYNRMDELGELLHDVEIRAGFDDATKYKGRYPISQINKKCAFFKGPGETDKHYELPCEDGSIEAKYVTIQIVAKDPEHLQIREIELIEDVCRGTL